MQTMFVGPEHAQSLSFIPAPGEQPVTDANATHQENLSLIRLEGQPPFKRLVYFAIKRLLALTVTLLTLGLLWPLLLMIAIAIKLESPGPILVAEERIGARRRRIYGQWQWTPVYFPLYKFRTTVTTMAPPVKPTRRTVPVTDHQIKTTGLGTSHATNKVAVCTADPVTAVGRLLRQSGLEQLPQLWNILSGDLTLVGPRPVLPDELSRYAPGYQRRFEAVPGMTGLWQLCAPRALPSVAQAKHLRAASKVLRFEQMVQLDLEYVEKQSFGLDVHILGNTVLAIWGAPPKIG